MRISTDNDFFLGGNRAVIAPILPIRIRSREQAFRTAAWILLMSPTLPWENPEGERPTFEEVKIAIGAT